MQCLRAYKNLAKNEAQPSHLMYELRLDNVGDQSRHKFCDTFVRSEWTLSTSTHVEVNQTQQQNAWLMSSGLWRVQCYWTLNCSKNNGRRPSHIQSIWRQTAIEKNRNLYILPTTIYLWAWPDPTSLLLFGTKKLCLPLQAKNYKGQEILFMNIICALRRNEKPSHLFPNICSFVETNSDLSKEQLPRAKKKIPSFPLLRV